MRQVKIEKADAGAIREGFLENQNQINAGGIDKHFDVFDCAIKTVENQYCEKCHPHLATKAKRGARIALCGDCTTQTETAATAIFENIAAPRKVVRLKKCSGCGDCKAPSKFSIYYGICKKSRISTALCIRRIPNIFAGGRLCAARRCSRKSPLPSFRFARHSQRKV